MKLNIKELLDFFDDKTNSKKGDATAVMAMLGEELNGGIYKDFRNNEVEILEESITQGFKGGNYLDSWMIDKDNDTLLQCEIKNWGARALGGKSLKLDSTDVEVKKIVEYYWNHQINKKDLSVNVKHPSSVSKVLLEMKPPKLYRNISNIEPLVIYWMPISSDSVEFNPLSIVSIKSLNLPTDFYIDKRFSKLYIFSVSLYLRQLYKKGQEFIDLNMPNLERRIKILNEFQL